MAAANSKSWNLSIHVICCFFVHVSLSCCTLFQGTIVRQRAGAIAQQGRSATGVIVQKLDENDGIKDVALVPEIDEKEAAATAVANASTSRD